jgi:hypothetical protein
MSLSQLPRRLGGENAPKKWRQQINQSIVSVFTIYDLMASKKDKFCTQ